MTYTELFTWREWKRRYEWLLYVCEDYSEEKLQRSIGGICRDLDISLDLFNEYVEEIESGRLALSV